jgi:Immunity protein 26
MDQLIMLKRRTVQIGDVFQILTSEGACYGQIINTNPKWKFVIAVFREFFAKEPVDFEALVKAQPQFITTFLIQDAIRQGLFNLVCNVPVAPSLVEFPTFRSTNNLQGDKTMWFFWRGEKHWKVHRPLTDIEKLYPKGPFFPNAASLIKMIEKNFRVERDYI